MISLRPIANFVRGKRDTFLDRIAEGLEAIQDELDKQRRQISNVATGLVGPAGPAGPAGPPGASATPPADASLSGGTYYYAEDGQTFSLQFTVAPPGPLGTFLGVHVYLEPYDQSDVTPTFTLDGTSPLDGTTAVLGQWAPTDEGKYSTSLVEIRGLPAVSRSTDVRVYAASYSAEVDNVLVRNNTPGATPSIVITVDPFSPKASSSRKYCDNPDFNGSPVAGSPDWSTGKRYDPFTINVTLPTDTANFAGWEAVLWYSGASWGTDYVLTPSLMTGTSALVEIEAPTTPEAVWIFLRGVGYDANGNPVRNPIIPGTTPSRVVTIGGTPVGTVDLGAALSTSLAAALNVTSGVLGVAPSGITSDLIAALAVQTTHLVDTAVTGPKIAGLAIGAAHIQNAVIGNAHFDRATANKIAIVDADIVNLSAAKITAGTLAAGVVYAGSVNASQVNAGAFNGCTLTLNLNSVTTTIGNVPYNATYAGLKTTHATFGTTYVTPGGLEVENSAGTEIVSVSTTGISLLNGGYYNVSGAGSYKAGSNVVIDSSGNGTFGTCWAVTAFKAGLGGSTGLTTTFATGDGRTATFKCGILTGLA